MSQHSSQHHSNTANGTLDVSKNLTNALSAHLLTKNTFTQISSKSGRGLYTSKDIKAGRVILSEIAIVSALNENVCHNCWTQPISSHFNPDTSSSTAALVDTNDVKTLQRCSNCKFAYYCSRKCQVCHKKSTQYCSISFSQ